MMTKYGLMVAGWIAVGGLAAAGTDTNAVPKQTIVVTATRVAMPVTEVGNSVTVVDSAQLSSKQDQTLAEAMRTVPGVDVVRNGGAGSRVAVHLRGTQSDQVLVLVDGVEVNDPSGTGRGADLSQLPVENIERIEILRGPQSTLYGADAIGGVINVITRKGAGPLAGEVSAEGGSFGTFNETAAMRGSNSRFNYSVGASRQDSEGISSAAEKNGNPEKDGFGRTELSSRLGWTPVSEFDATALIRWNRSNYDYDSFLNGAPADSADHAEAERLLLNGEGKLRLFDGQWEQRLAGSWVDHDRNDVSAMGDSSFDSLLKKAEWQNDVHVGEANTVTAGVEWEEESSESVYEGLDVVDRFERQTARNKAAYLQDSAKAGALSATAGVRVDDPDTFASETTWRVAPVYEIAPAGTRVKGSYGTGFKAPSLFQLYSIYGSPELGPEKCRGWDAGVEQDLGERVTLGVTYFMNELEDMIEYDFATSKYGNVAEAETKGVESFVTARAMDDLTVRASYTYMDTLDKATGAELRQRPRNKGSVEVSYAFTSKFRGTAGVTWVGEREDLNYATYQAETLAAYTLVNLYAAYDVRKNVTLFGRIENLFDEVYEQVIGYGTPGRAGYGGVKVTF
jgi:vitamin B12 transporter